MIFEKLSFSRCRAWIGNRFRLGSRPSQIRVPKRDRSFRPQLLALEDRCLLSAASNELAVLSTTSKHETAKSTANLSHSSPATVANQSVTGEYGIVIAGANSSNGAILANIIGSAYAGSASSVGVSGTRWPAGNSLASQAASNNAFVLPRNPNSNTTSIHFTPGPGCVRLRFQSRDCLVEPNHASKFRTGRCLSNGQCATFGCADRPSLDAGCSILAFAKLSR